MHSPNGDFEMSVVVHGRPIFEYPYQGEVFVEGREKTTFALRIRNNTYRTCVAVVSVDGLSVMNGKEATGKESGYVIRPRGSVDIPGWRLNNQDVAEFRFGKPEGSYAALIGNPTNIGVIGAVITLERHVPLPRFKDSEVRLRSAGPVAKGMNRGPSMSPGLGTEFGSRAQHQVSTVSVNLEDHPAAQLAIRYDTGVNLEARGIILSDPHAHNDAVLAANPFPGQEGATPPPGWKPRG